MLTAVGCGSDTKSTAGTAADGGGDGGSDGGVLISSTDAGLPPLALGAPITATEAPDKTWTWIDFPETRCMNDSATGLGIRLNKASDKAIFVIQGGGACFNPTTCAGTINPNGFGKNDLITYNRLGLLDPNDADNPFADWNMVFIPYCSGDIFSGNAANKTGYGGRTQVGYKNFQEYLKRLVPTFQDMSKVVLSGYSAGGFAASINWVQARQAFGPNVRVDVLNDSGPTMGPKYLTPCLQQRLAKVWNWKGTIPAGCTDCNIATGNVTQPAVLWTIAHTHGGRHGIISSDEDSIIKIFFGFGQDKCANIDAFSGVFPTGLYPEGLADLRATFKGNPGAAMFVMHSTQHVWTTHSPGSVISHGVVLRDWIKQFLDPSSEWKDVLP